MMLFQFARGQAAELREVARRIWVERDRLAYETASASEAFDTSPEAARLRRYLNDSLRHERQAFDDLRKSQRDRERENARPARPYVPPDEPAFQAAKAGSQNEPNAPQGQAAAGLSTTIWTPPGSGFKPVVGPIASYALAKPPSDAPPPPR